MSSGEKVQAGLGKQIFTKKNDIVARRIAGDLFLVPIRGNLADMQRIFSLNAIGEFIWERLDSPRNLNDIRYDLSSTFRVSEEDAMTDIEEFVSELLDAGLIVEKR